MTEQEALSAIEMIKRMAADDEMAHRREDDLREEFIRSVEDGSLRGKKARKIAKIILSSNDIKFARWCA